MIILAHRGAWTAHAERNTPAAFERALTSGFGIETDLRDHDGEVVISHDPPPAGKPALKFREFLELYAGISAPGMLALNIKADGLHDRVQEELARFNVGPDRYFLFDMAPPDALGYLRRQMPCYTRESEIEPVPAFLDRAVGVWMDCFFEDWIDEAAILKHLKVGRAVALVSPELHGRTPENAWNRWREFGRRWNSDDGAKLLLCTDHANEAQRFFNGED